MFTLGLVCLFISFFMAIMGLMAWGAWTQPKPDAETPPEQTGTSDQNQTPDA